jgi:hypothetical protein
MISTFVQSAPLGTFEIVHCVYERERSGICTLRTLRRREGELGKENYTIGASNRTREKKRGHRHKAYW